MIITGESILPDKTYVTLQTPNSQSYVTWTQLYFSYRKFLQLVILSTKSNHISKF